ncbi:hypothetical protein ASG37_16460 [Sphingomonas sp. Leaf407]|nr:hypothetical protein ASE97_16450 [Sphingomonas sp. Leaf42]KQT25024.1 hypothetical protein ASG37_16460 [Sphingomonas sp. Leaf407]
MLPETSDPSVLLPLDPVVEARRRSLRNLAIAVMFAMLLVALVIVPILLPTQGNDAETVASLSTSADTADSFDGYAVMSLIYAYTNKATQFVILLGFGATLIGMFLWWLRVPRMLAIGCFCLLSPIFLYLTFFIKDTFTTPVAIATTLILLSQRIPALVKAAAVGAVYIGYAFVFRQYYLIIIALWFGILLFLKASWGWRAVLITLVPLVMLAVPKELYDTLQMQRDVVNITRAGFAGAGNRTAFLNLVEPDGLGTFVINFLYAAVRLNLPFFGAGPKEVYLFANLCIYAWLMITGLRSGNPRISWPAGLFLAHVLVLTIFEPDLGSYLRHVSTALLLLAPSLVMHDRLFQQEERRPLPLPSWRSRWSQHREASIR